MRWVSVATFVGAALLPAASARPACRPDRPTTTLDATTTTATTAVIKTLSTDTATVAPTSSVASVTSALTGALETTVANSVTATLESTTLMYSITTTETDTATVGATSSATTVTSAFTGTFETTVATSVTATLESSTLIQSATATETNSETMTDTTAATTTEAAEPTNYVKNGDFETVPNADWQVSAGAIEDNASKARSPTHYASRMGQAQYVFQILHGLDLQRRYRLTVHTAVFSSPAPSSDPLACTLSATHSGAFPMDEFNIDFNNLDVYQPSIFEFTPFSSIGGMSITIRCDPRSEYSFSIGFDDISVVDIGPDPSG
ncbi:hypothetical protein HG530_013002 [Fusarium avenaceum]|nr:hypothetical protein HG530_013002 [Fusarium avenaceum]